MCCCYVTSFYSNLPAVYVINTVKGHSSIFKLEVWGEQGEGMEGRALALRLVARLSLILERKNEGGVKQETTCRDTIQEAIV